MRYLPKSDSERREMLDAIGAESLESLFAHLPEAVRLRKPLDLPPGISEYEIVQYFRDLAAQTRPATPASWAAERIAISVPCW